MRKPIIIFLVLLIALFATTTIYATDPYTKNIGFETGSFNENWTCVTKKSPQYPYQDSPPPNPRATIMRDTNAYDTNAGKLLKIIPSGYRYSVRLGNDDGGGWSQNLKYTMKVDSSNELLVVKFAAVFRASTNGSGPAGSGAIGSYSFGDPSDFGPGATAERVLVSKTEHVYNYYIHWTDWTTVGFELTDYIGKTITLNFSSSDCMIPNYPYGYVYFVAETHPMGIIVKYCPEDKFATLYAPEGFKEYQWLDSKGKILDSTQILVVKNPVVGTKYICNLTSIQTDLTTAIGSVSTVIPDIDPISADFTHSLIDCKHFTDTVHFTSLQPPKNLKLQYQWDFGDGATSTEQNPTHIYHNSGIHQVSLMVHTPLSLCTTSLSKMVETFSPLYVGISGDSTYCLGYTTTLKGYGAYSYKWSNGATTDSIEVGKDTTVWMIGYSSAGCHTDTIRFKVKQEPDWVFTTDGKESYCQGEYTVLWGSGAANYIWSNGATTSSITVKTPGVYTLLASNVKGCEKSKTFTVVEYPKPNVDFSMSTNTINSRHNELICSVPYENGVQYNWEMGDHSTETGSTIHHIYNNTSDILGYNDIVLKAINQEGCLNTASKRVEITPFFPNVFSPNGDGVNDLFMEGYDLSIFDRNGLLLYKGTSGWNGTYQGQKLGSDTYFYSIDYTDKNHQIQSRKGYVTLKR